MRFLDHKVTICVIFQGTTRLFSKMAKPLYLPTSNAWGFQFLNILLNICYCLFYYNICVSLFCVAITEYLRLCSVERKKIISFSFGDWESRSRGPNQSWLSHHNVEKGIPWQESECASSSLSSHRAINPIMGLWVCDTGGKMPICTKYYILTWEVYLLRFLNLVLPKGIS